MIQAAHFDIKTVTGLRQALVLSAEYENEPFPLEGYTLHGSIGTYPRVDLKCSVDENGRARIEWDSVPPGNWKYDVFLISAGNDETPLMEGTFTALPRITPVLDDESVNDEVGGVLHLPSGNEGVITLEVDGGFVSKEYAAIAKDAADRAEQALESIKQALQGVVTSLGGESGDILLDSGLKITRNAKENSVSLSLDDKTVVLTAGSQTIDGVKTFSAAPVIAAAPVADNEAANKKYVDDVAGNATDTTINGVSGAITLNLPLNMDAGSKVLSVDLSNYASLRTDNTFTGSNTFFAGIKGHVDSVTGTDILYATNVPGDSSSGHPVLTIEHIGSSNVRISSGTHLMLKARGGNIYAESSFTANNSVNVYGSALFNSGVTASQSLTVGGHAQFNNIVRVETGKIDPGNFGHTWIFGSLIDSPTTADNNNHRLCCKSTSDNAAYILYHERVVNGAWMKDKIIPACQFDFSWHNDASIVVKTPTEAKQAANKDYVDSQFNSLPLSYVTLDTDQTIKGQKNFTGNIAVNSSGNNGTLTLYTSGGTGYLSMDTGEMVIPTDYLTITGQTNIQTLNVQGASIFIGGVTMNQPINANGGINIPLAAGVPTATGGVNRFYALGLAGAMSALVQPIYLNSSSITVAGSIYKSSNGTLAGLTQRFSVGAASAGANAYGSAVIPLTGPNGQFNYSSVCGFSLAVNATAFAKFTFGIGRGSKTNRTGLTMDSYSMIPGNDLAVNHGEIIDVTINTPYDTVRKGYEIRVREIFYVSSVGHWQVKTTTVFLPVGHNELMPNGLNRLIYMQSGLPSTAVREEKAALYMELGGGSTNTLFKIASLRGFINFEAGTGVSTLIIDARNEKPWALSADAGTGTRHLYFNGVTNPTYHALEAMAVNAIEAEETADFEDINIPL